jgi:hypothetical protein
MRAPTSTTRAGGRSKKSDGFAAFRDSAAKMLSATPHTPTGSRYDSLLSKHVGQRGRIRAGFDAGSDGRKRLVDVRFVHEPVAKEHPVQTIPERFH